MRRNSLFTDREGNLDAPTLVAFLIGLVAAIAIVAMICGEVAAMFLRPDHAFNAEQLGGGVAWILAGLFPFLTGYAAYWASDAYNMRTHAETK